MYLQVEAEEYGTAQVREEKEVRKTDSSCGQCQKCALKLHVEMLLEWQLVPARYKQGTRT